MNRLLFLIGICALQFPIVAQEIENELDEPEETSGAYRMALKIRKSKEGYVLLQDSTAIFGAVVPVKMTNCMKVTKKNGEVSFYPFKTVKEFKYGAQTLIIGPKKEFYRAYMKGPKMYLYESIPWNTFWTTYMTVAHYAPPPSAIYFLWKKEGDITIRSFKEARIHLADCDKVINLLDDKKYQDGFRGIFQAYNYQCD